MQARGSPTSAAVANGWRCSRRRNLGESRCPVAPQKCKRWPGRGGVADMRVVAARSVERSGQIIHAADR